MLNQLTIDKGRVLLDGNEIKGIKELELKISADTSISTLSLKIDVRSPTVLK